MSTNDKIDDLFKNQDDWDFETPNQGHEKRFLDKLKKKQPKKKEIGFRYPLRLRSYLALGFYT